MSDLPTHPSTHGCACTGFGRTVKCHTRVKSVHLCRFAEGLSAGSLQETELILLDSIGLQASHLEAVLSRLERLGASSALLVLSLQGNLLTDDACNLISTALHGADFCPALSVVNLNDNYAITRLGLETLHAALRHRVNLKVRFHVIRAEAGLCEACIDQSLAHPPLFRFLFLYCADVSESSSFPVVKETSMCHLCLVKHCSGRCCECIQCNESNLLAFYQVSGLFAPE